MENFPISWEAREYEIREKKTDWYWAVGIISVSAIIASIMFENYLFAGVVFLASVLTIIYSKKTPSIVSCEINDSGIRFGNVFYEFEKIISYNLSREEKSLIIKSKKMLAPLIIIPVENIPMEKIEAFLVKRIKKENLKLPSFKKILDNLGF